MLEGHSKAVNSISYHPFSNYLASCSEDSSVRIWDVHPLIFTKDVSKKAESNVNFGKCLLHIRQKFNCEGLQLDNTKGLEVQAPSGKGTLSNWLFEQGAVLTKK